MIKQAFDFMGSTTWKPETSHLVLWHGPLSVILDSIKQQGSPWSWVPILELLSFCSH